MNNQKEKSDREAVSHRAKELATFPATVSEVIPASNPGEPDQARVSVDDAREPYNEIRVNSALRNSCGDPVTLAKGDHVRLR